MSYKTNYLKSCFITLLLSLLYIVLIKTILIQEVFGTTTGFKYGELIIAISTLFIFLTGIIAPLSFFLAGKYTTKVKEPARPDMIQSEVSADKKANKSSTQIDAKHNLAEHTKTAISCNPHSKISRGKGVTQSSTSSTCKRNSSQNIIDSEKSSDVPISKQQPNPADYVTLYASNIPYKVNDSGLRELLKPFGGTIFSIHLTRDPVTKKRKGIAFIRMSKPEGLKAIEQLNGTLFQGREIVVKVANDHGKKPEDSNE